VDIPRVELCRSGTWNGHDYTVADLARVAANWLDLKGRWDVPLTLGHDGESALGDGAPALGWVDDVRLEGDTLVGSYRKVPQKLAALMQSGAYPKRSCTFLTNAEIDGERRDIVLRNVALLGANQPAVDGLADLFPLYNRRRLAATGGDAITVQLADEKPSKTEGGVVFHVSDYAYTPDDSDPSTWKLRTTKTPGGKADAGLVGAAAAAMGKGFRGNKVSIPTADRDAVKSRLRGAWKEANPDKSEDDMPDVLQNSRATLLARLPDATRAALAAFVTAHPQAARLVSGPSADDIMSAVMKALTGQYPPASGNDEEDDDKPGMDGPSCNVIDWFLGSDPMSVVVSDQDVDNLWEIPFTYDAGNDSALLQAPIPVKGTYTQNTTGAETGGEQEAAPAADGAQADGDGEAADMAQMARLAERVIALAKEPVDSDVERLVTELSSDLDGALTKLNAIAAGKAGVTELRTLLGLLKKGLGKFNIADKPAAGAAPQPKTAQNARQEVTDVKLTELARKLGLPETATESEIDSAIAGAVATKGIVATLARRMDERDQRDAETAVDRMLADAVSEGRLKRWAKPGEDGELYTQIKKLARTDFATAQAIIAAQPKFVDSREYGAAGNQSDAPSFDLTPGVQRELRKLGRDPESINPQSLGERWEKQIRERQLARAQKFGIPAPDRLVSPAGR
jgi:hypothetical protein